MAVLRSTKPRLELEDLRVGDNEELLLLSLLCRFGVGDRLLWRLGVVERLLWRLGELERLLRLYDDTNDLKQQAAVHDNTTKHHVGIYVKPAHHLAH